MPSPSIQGLTFRANGTVAPDTPTSRGAGVGILSALLGVLALLPKLPFLVLHFIFRRPSLPFGVYIKSHVLKAITSFAQLPYPETDSVARSVPKPIVPFGNVMDTVKLEVIDVAPAPESWCTGYAAAPAAVPRVTRPGFMLSPAGAPQGAVKAEKGETLILYIHGGAYVRGHPMWVPYGPKLARDTHLRVLAVQYRKCCSDSTAYPAPLLDALAAWHYATGHLGFEPANIVVTGDSAGGHLTLALALQLHSLSKTLPGGLALISPWADFTLSFKSWQTNTDDYLDLRRISKAVKSTLRHYEAGAARTALFSPALAPAGHWGWLAATPVLVSYGTLETLADEGKALIKGMRADGVDVAVYEDVNGLHDGPVTQFSPGVYARFKDGVVDILKQMDTKGNTEVHVEITPAEPAEGAGEQQQQ